MQTRNWRFHDERNRLLAEAHARPPTPVAPPLMASRIATMSGEDGEANDRAHMADLCRRLGASEPGPTSRWCLVEGGLWRLRWERHTEVSTWTVLRDSRDADAAAFQVTALDLVAQDWLAALPGVVLGAAHVALVERSPAELPFAEADLIGSRVGDGAIEVLTDFRPGPDAFTRFIMVQNAASQVIAGRVLQQLFEIETYRLLALLAFPMATAAGSPLSRLESEAEAAAREVAAEANGVAGDRKLLARLAALAAEAEAFAGGSSFRFSAARAYHGLVQERIAQLRERAVEGRPTIAEFMDRRLAPAMRTVTAVGERQREVIVRVARTTQLLSTRVEVASEETNVSLLQSMDKRAAEQLRLQRAVEGFSVVAISYYAVGLLHIFMKALTDIVGGVKAELLTGIVAPFMIFAVWRLTRSVGGGLFGPKPGDDKDNS
jgi:uncharacterized membrane-anchored protein